MYRVEPGMAIRSGFRCQSLANRLIGAFLWVILPLALLVAGVYAIVDPGPEDPGTLTKAFGFAAIWTVVAFLSTRPVTVALGPEGVTRTDVWSVRRIPYGSVARLCASREHGRTRIAIRSRAGSLLTLEDDFGERDKARLLEGLARAVAPHGVAVETSQAALWSQFGYVDGDGIRRAGEHTRRLATWAVLLLGTAAVVGIVVLAGFAAYERGEGIVAFVLPPGLVVLLLMAAGVIARRDALFPIACLFFGGFLVSLLLYPLFAPPFWTGPGPQTLPPAQWAALFLGGLLSLGAGYALLREVRTRRLAATT